MQRFFGRYGAWAGVGLLVASGLLFAQSSPLDLQLPPRAVDYQAARAPVQSGIYYGDHRDALSGNPGADAARGSNTHIGGSISTGFYGGGRHVGSGMWNEADIDVSKPTGSGGMMSFSLGIGQIHGFGGSRYGY